MVGGNDADEIGFNDAIKRSPAVDSDIAPLSHFIKTTSPSPLLKFGLLNALYPYVYCLRYFSGDVWSEANLRDCVAICVILSDNLRSEKGDLWRFGICGLDVEIALENCGVEENDIQSQTKVHFRGQFKLISSLDAAPTTSLPTKRWRAPPPTST